MHAITRVLMATVLATGSIGHAEFDDHEGPATPAVTDQATPPPARAPRRSYFCAALLGTAPHRNLTRTKLLAEVGQSKNVLVKSLEATNPKGLIRRFIAWLSAFDEFHLDDLTYVIPNARDFTAKSDERQFVRKVLWRLREIERDVVAQPPTTFPMKSVLRGRDEIRTYLRALREGATRLERDHAVDVAFEFEPPVGTPEQRRVGLFWKDLGRAMLYTGVSALSAYGALRGWQLDSIPAIVLSAGVGVGFGARGLQKAFGPLRISFNTYVDDLDRQELETRRRDYEAHVRRADEQLRQIDDMLTALDADPATQVNRFVYHGYNVELPMRNTPTYSNPVKITAPAIIAGERMPDAYDPVLNRWVVVDQIFQFDENGEPTLVTVMREQLGYGQTLVYDAYINNSGFMP